MLWQINTRLARHIIICALLLIKVLPTVFDAKTGLVVYYEGHPETPLVLYNTSLRHCSVDMIMNYSNCPGTREGRKTPYLLEI